jgi:hypothetical protein
MTKVTKSSHSNQDGSRTRTTTYTHSDGSGSSYSKTTKPGPIFDKHVSSSSSKWGATKK